MQTFLPYCSMLKSLDCLDNKRLGKQRVEAYQIWNIVSGKNPNSRWKNHPAVKMWRGWLDALSMYGNIAILLWIRRGFKNNMDMYFVNIWDDFGHRNTLLDCVHAEPPKHPLEDRLYKLIQYEENKVIKPDWFGRGDFHESHQSNLIRKMPEHYSQFRWNVPNNLSYVWPEGKY